jgi:hypothetical protein
MDCAPCFRRDCPKIAAEGETPPCQLLLTPEIVLGRCLALPAANGSDRPG